MATQFEEIYSRFLTGVRDYSLAKLDDEEMTTFLESLLVAAIPKFRRCLTDLSDRDMELKVFNKDLSENVQDILAHLMFVEYLQPSVLTTDLLKQSMSDKDYKMYSQSAHISAVSSLYKDKKAEVDGMITDYTFLNAEMSDLK